ncbi:MAG: 23S rRNA (guanosine(2251)-2'-O)-methyltransferase RlmB [Candidatus Zixiibacteriota bacterium]|nr:MAG: 23S rRNA (guanosine(2251)-2'-O)-methyltransferase RlmB [candidate division Zixibacteria bacterium]
MSFRGKKQNSRSGQRAKPSRLSRHADFSADIPARGEDFLFDLLSGLSSPALLLVLDTVQDPHNLGACLRVADGAGAHAVVAPKDRSVGLTTAVRSVASGAAEHVPFVQVTNLARTLTQLKESGLWIVGTADSAGQSLYDTDLTMPLALVMGSEGKGLRRLTAETCDLLVSLPMRGHVSSLNVSVAAGICLYEAVRQRSCKSGEQPK